MIGGLGRGVGGGVLGMVGLCMWIGWRGVVFELWGWVFL